MKNCSFRPATVSWARRSLLAMACFSSAAFATPAVETFPVTTPRVDLRAEGIQFNCDARELPRLISHVDTYLGSLGIATKHYVKHVDAAKGQVTFTLATPQMDTNTLDLRHRPEYAVQDEVIELPGEAGRKRYVQTVSKKEIALALLQHGRLTEFGPKACKVGALQDHVGVRQNIVAWSEVLEWGWPDGEAAKWNTRYWDKGTPKGVASLHEALTNMFVEQSKYEIGCYTATKMVMAHAILDYYVRVARYEEVPKVVIERLMSDGEPLVGVEPGRMWDFFPDFDKAEASRPGKLLKIQYGIAPKNFIPGDWNYFRNTDVGSQDKTGYEGSNAIYLGRNKFDDYYNDNNHSYSYREKLDEVYQWRNGVFSRSRDWDKITALSDTDFDALSQPPEQGGLLMTLRVVPYFFDYEELPSLKK